MEHFFAYTSRMRFISRWALMRNSQPENIQEHSHQVAVLAHALAVIRNRCFGGRVDPGTVAVAALYHDASEILTGDLPTPSSTTIPPSGMPISRWSISPAASWWGCCRRSYSRTLPRP